jgi:hypothetical protein
MLWRSGYTNARFDLERFSSIPSISPSNFLTPENPKYRDFPPARTVHRHLCRERRLPTLSLIKIFAEISQTFGDEWLLLLTAFLVALATTTPVQVEEPIQDIT